MNTTQLQTAKREIEKVLRRYNVPLEDILPLHTPLPRKQKIDVKAWERARGIWKNRRMPDPVEWQRQIRKEWERKLP